MSAAPRPIRTLAVSSSVSLAATSTYRPDPGARRLARHPPNWTGRALHPRDLSRPRHQRAHRTASRQQTRPGTSHCGRFRRHSGRRPLAACRTRHHSRRQRCPDRPNRRPDQAPRPRHPAQPLHPTSGSSRDDDQPRPRPVIHGAQNASASRASGPIGSGTPPPTASAPQAAPSPALWPSLAGAAPTCSSDMTAPVSQHALPTKLDGSTSKLDGSSSEPSDMARFMPKAQRSSWASQMRSAAQGFGLDRIDGVLDRVIGHLMRSVSVGGVPLQYRDHVPELTHCVIGNWVRIKMHQVVTHFAQELEPTRKCRSVEGPT